MLIVILHSCFTPLREQSKAWTTTCLTSEFLLCTVSVLQSKLWPTSWSPPQCGTVSLSCPTHHGSVLPRFDSGETKATDTQVTIKRTSRCYLQFQDNKEEFSIESLIPVESKCTGNHSSKWKAEEKPKPHPSSVLQHRGWEHTSCHMGHLIPHFELELLDKWICIIICTSHLREIYMLQKYLIIIHITNHRLTGTLQKCSYNNFIEKGSDVTAQYYQPIPSENNYHHEI